MSAEAAGVDLYVHAPYIVNVATTNNRIRIPSRKLLQQHASKGIAQLVQGFGRQFFNEQFNQKIL